MSTQTSASAPERHGDVFADGLGAMIVHVQRESGLAHRTFVLKPWQVRFVRAASHRGVRVLVAMLLLSWGYFAFEAARVPLLTTRLERMEHEALRLDTLEGTLRQLQDRYEQVQKMLSAPAATRRGTTRSDSSTDGAGPTSTSTTPPSDNFQATFF
jgi:hypothetical protein